METGWRYWIPAIGGATALIAVAVTVTNHPVI